MLHNKNISHFINVQNSDLPLIMRGFQNIPDCKNCNYYCLFSEKLTEPQLELLNKTKREIVYKKGETIVKQGSYVSHVAFIKNGLLKLQVEGINGKNLIVKLISSGEFMGFPALDNIDSYPFTIVTLSEAILCLIKKETILNVLQENTALNRKIIAWYGNDYRLLYRKLTMMGTKNIHGRLAETLLYLCQDKFTEQNVFQHITRREVAEFMGASVESMLKIMNELKADNIIKTTGKKIEIKDYEMLKRLSKIG